MEEQTIFDKILRGEIPCDKVFEDENVLAFRDVNPQAPVHVLVIPKVKIGRFAEIRTFSAEETGRFFQAVSRIASSLNLDGAGYRIVLNNGDDGGQTVEYLHAHILGGRRMNWPPG